MTDIELHFGAGLGSTQVSEEAKRLEELGFDYGGAGEHFMRGTPPSPSDMALPVMAAASGATRNLRVVSTVILTPLYHPVLLAKMTSTIDTLSEGRVTLGVGTGGEFPVEFEAMGVPVTERGARTNEVLTALKRLWTEENVTHHGRFFEFNNVTLNPLPHQKPHPPIWVAGRKDIAMTRAARFGNGWLPYFYGPDRYRNSRERITEIATQEGRDLHDFTWAHLSFISINKTKEEAASVAASRLGARYRSQTEMLSIVGSYCVLGSVSDCIEKLGQYVDAGVRTFIFSWCCPPEELRMHIETTAKEIIPALRREFK